MLKASDHHVLYLKEFHAKLLKFCTLNKLDSRLNKITNETAFEGIRAVIRYTIYTHDYFESDVWLLNSLAKIDIAFQQLQTNHDDKLWNETINLINNLCNDYISEPTLTSTATLEGMLRRPPGEANYGWH